MATYDLFFSYIRHVTLKEIGDRDMQYCYFLKSTCDIASPPPHIKGLSYTCTWTLVVPGEGWGGGGRFTLTGIRELKKY